MKKLVTLVCPLVLIGCTTISIVDQGGKVSVSRNWGTIKVELNPGTQTALAEITGLGYLSGPLGTTLGFSKSSFVALGENCQLILWIKDAEQVQQLKNTLANPENLCIISTATKGKSK
jgi:hypothetical protein